MLRTYHPLQKSQSGNYLASVVEYVREKGSEEKVRVWENSLLIRAESPKDALAEAIRLVKEREYEYQGEDGHTYENCYGGITHLSPIHDELESGAELLWLDLTGIDEASLIERVAGLELEEVYAKFDHVTEESSEYPPQALPRELRGEDDTDEPRA